ncbi:hypothetical protein GCM10007382_19310 [Salinibacterium xinjiangense]|uniref:hypothetical protein n=1 Tax=Salinibacterium xinjiangense TaxID=386302 RepID=UPI000BE2F11A|nr:hypothetical protein [Salinibacterium xinjiangense]GGK99308.1 hypothetical protein GCM10007382_19310 [Salinibacterium xinjiangense]
MAKTAVRFGARTSERVGRGPLRKLSRGDRVIGPAVELAEHGLEAWSLPNAVGAAPRFDVEEDAGSVELQVMLRSRAAADALAESVTGLEPTHPLFPHVVEVIELRLAH